MCIKQLEEDIKNMMDKLEKAQAKLADFLSKAEAQYPVSTMPACEMSRAYHRQPFADEKQRCADLANAVLRHACDNGQVVPRAEFDRAIGDRAARDMAVATEVLKSLLWVFQPIDKVAREFDQDYLLKVIARANKGSL